MEGKKIDKVKQLKLMRYWLFGTFVIVFAAVTAYLGIYTTWQTALVTGLPIWGLTAVLCVAAYFFYQWYLNRKTQKTEPPSN